MSVKLKPYMKILQDIKNKKRRWVSIMKKIEGKKICNYTNSVLQIFEVPKAKLSFSYFEMHLWVSKKGAFNIL